MLCLKKKEKKKRETRRKSVIALKWAVLLMSALKYEIRSNSQRQASVPPRYPLITTALRHTTTSEVGKFGILLSLSSIITIIPSVAIKLLYAM